MAWFAKGQDWRWEWPNASGHVVYELFQTSHQSYSLMVRDTGDCIGMFNARTVDAALNEATTIIREYEDVQDAYGTFR